jgi:ABC-type Fe3+-hydroxamate transport system substrate-binding protein
MTAQRILVCGGRTFGRVPHDIPAKDLPQAMLQAEQEKIYLREVLNRLTATLDVECIIDGDAKGADRLAGKWAVKNDFKRLAFPITSADWKRLGKGAGHIRNKQMIDEGKPTLVIAFPGGTGTKDMVAQAKEAGIPVYEVGYYEES